MLDAIYISAIGLQAQKEQLDAAANNVANTSTVGFKRRSVDFSTILDRAPVRASIDMAPAGTESAARKLRVDLAQGDLQATGRSLDVAISGAGFIEVDAGQGVSAYSRGGSLK